MPKKPFSDYAQELAAQRAVWERKASLRAVYTSWYQRIVAELSQYRPTVELGAGCGNFKEHYADVIATDAIEAGPWIDQLVDARHMPFGDNEVGNFVMIDVLHHLPRPLDFLRRASRALVPGGRIILLEPAATPWSRLVFGMFHHEPIDLSQDLFGEDGTPEPPNEGFTFANQGIAHLLFVDGYDTTLERLPDLMPIAVEYSDFLVYPLTGGFSYFNFVPGGAVNGMLGMERKLTGRTGKTTAMRLLIVLEKAETDRR